MRTLILPPNEINKIDLELMQDKSHDKNVDVGLTYFNHWLSLSLYFQVINGYSRKQLNPRKVFNWPAAMPSCCSLAWWLKPNGGGLNKCIRDLLGNLWWRKWCWWARRGQSSLWTKLKSQYSSALMESQHQCTGSSRSCCLLDEILN